MLNPDPALAQAQLRARIKDPVVLQKTLIIGMRYHTVFDRLQGLLCPLTALHHNLTPNRNPIDRLPKHLAVFLEIVSEYYDTVGKTHPQNAEVTLTMVEERLVKYIGSIDRINLACPRQIGSAEAQEWYRQIQLDWEGVANETAENLCAALHSEPVKAYLDSLRQQQFAKYFASSSLGRTREQIEEEFHRIYSASNDDEARISEAVRDDIPQDLPPFPRAILPDTGLIDEIFRTRQVNASLTAPCIIGTISMALGKAVVADSFVRPGELTWPNENVLIAASSGYGKNVSEIIMQPILEADRILRESWKKNKLPELKARKERLTEEIKRLKKPPAKNQQRLDARVNGAEAAPDKSLKELAEKIAELDQIEDQLANPPGLLAQDVTSEKLGIFAAQNNGTASIFSSEGGDIVANIMGRYRDKGTTDDSIYNSGFSGNYYSQKRVGRNDITIPNLLLQQLILCQPDIVDGIFANRRLREGGFLPRFLLSYLLDLPPKLQVLGDPQPISGEVLRRHHDLITSLLDTFRLGHPGPPFPIGCEPDVRVFFRIYENHKREEQLKYPHLRQFIARHTEHAVRVSLSLHAWQHGVACIHHPVTLKTAQSACDFVTWQWQHQLFALGQRQAFALGDSMQRLMVVIRRHPGSDERKLRQLTWRDFPDVSAVRNALARLKEEEMIIQQGSDNGKIGWYPV